MSISVQACQKTLFVPKQFLVMFMYVYLAIYKSLKVSLTSKRLHFAGVNTARFMYKIMAQIIKLYEAS